MRTIAVTLLLLVCASTLNGQDQSWTVVLHPAVAERWTELADDSVWLDCVFGRVDADAGQILIREQLPARAVATPAGELVMCPRPGAIGTIHRGPAVGPCRFGVADQLSFAGSVEQVRLLYCGDVTRVGVLSRVPPKKPAPGKIL